MGQTWRGVGATNFGVFPEILILKHIGRDRHVSRCARLCVHACVCVRKCVCESVIVFLFVCVHVNVRLYT